MIGRWLLENALNWAVKLETKCWKMQVLQLQILKHFFCPFAANDRSCLTFKNVK